MYSIFFTCIVFYVVTATDRPKFVRTRCVIEVVGGVFVSSSCFLDFFMGGH